MPRPRCTYIPPELRVPGAPGYEQGVNPPLRALREQTTSTGSSGGSARSTATRRYDPWTHLSNDGCTYFETVEDVKWLGLVVLFPLEERALYPETSRVINDIIESRFLAPSPNEDHGGEKWSRLPNHVIGFYFDVMRLLKNLWYSFNAAASKCYRDKVCRLKKSRVQPKYIHDSEWPKWLDYWASRDAMDLADQNQQNRVKDGSDEDDGLSKHYLGTSSQATRNVRKRLKGEEEKSYMSLLRDAKHKGGKWVCKRYEKIDEDVEMLCATTRLELEVAHDLTIEEENKIFLDVKPPNEKGVVYGLGNLGRSIASSSIRGTPATMPTSTQTRLSVVEAENAVLRQSQQTLASQFEKQIWVLKKVLEQVNIGVDPFAEGAIFEGFGSGADASGSGASASGSGAGGS